MKQSKIHQASREDQPFERAASSAARELTLGYTVFIRGETDNSQVLTGLSGHAKETGFYFRGFMSRKLIGIRYVS